MQICILRLFFSLFRVNNIEYVYYVYSGSVVLKRLNEKQSFHMLSSNNKLFLILDKT